MPGQRTTGDRRQGRSDGAGWEFVHVAVEDAARIAVSAIYPDERARSACALLVGAVRDYASLGIRSQRGLTDNSACYKSRRFRRLGQRLGITPIRTQPYTPRTHGKAERFIQTAPREWAHARAYETSDPRAHHLPAWLHPYNWHRPHASLGYLPPINRCSSVNDLVALHS